MTLIRRQHAVTFDVVLVKSGCGCQAAPNPQMMPLYMTICGRNGTHTHTHTGTPSHTHTDRHTYPSEQLEAEVKAIREAFKVIAHMKRFVGSLHSVGHRKRRGGAQREAWERRRGKGEKVQH